MRSRVLFALLVAVAVFAVAAAPARALNPQIAGLQVALRAYGLYLGAIDGIAGPKTVRAVRAFQRRAGVPVDGRAGLRTRRALGPLGQPLFGKRILRRGMFGWDVSVLQFLLARRGGLIAIDGYFSAQTERALRRYQRFRHLALDGIAGPRTMAAFAGRAPVLAPRLIPVAEVSSRPPPVSIVRALLNRWAAKYGLSQRLVRALAWMESGYQTNLVSRSGARGVMQTLPSTRAYVETVLLGRPIPRTVDGDVQVGVLYFRHLLREFGGNEARALAAWYQGDQAVKLRGVYGETRIFVANVLALERQPL